MRFTLFGFLVFKEQAGVISKDPCWVCLYPGYGHFCSGFFELVRNVIREYKNDRHLVG